MVNSRLCVFPNNKPTFFFAFCPRLTPQGCQGRCPAGVHVRLVKRCCEKFPVNNFVVTKHFRQSSLSLVFTCLYLPIQVVKWQIHFVSKKVLWRLPPTALRCSFPSISRGSLGKWLLGSPNCSLHLSSSLLLD